MLDTDTKRRIDTARDILVGKVPDPKSQVEQITIALIYKFMDDIDAESEELGGERKFFAGEFAKYGWAKLMNSGLGGYDTLNIYSEAITRMRENPGIPPLFRSIFDNAYLPYRDPETLRAFLKVIDEFTYDYTERLGDAFEYLLSVMGAQGDAGQFLTPRHIIDFIVAIVDPKKSETVLDPACGTAGFLISSYNHIKAANTDEERQSTLTPDDRGRLADNFKGYDISPDMVRLSLANMYLHGFAKPHIFEYDTLTSDDRWDEHADVILANPPFMSPKGGIRPHNRFSVQSKRSEVLFVDYMAEHLTPNGRAGIIVPEGIIFQSQKAHTRLRRMLVEDYLVAVVSLPAGVFQPYSGVKTSILILDRALARRTDRLAFFKVENDGYDLGAQRREIDKNDLPHVRRAVREYLDMDRRDGGTDTNMDGQDKDRQRQVQESRTSYASMLDQLIEHGAALIVEKEQLAANGDYNLSGERYRANDERQTSFPGVRLGHLLKLEFGTRITKRDNEGTLFPVYGGGGESFRTDVFTREDDVVISRFAMSEQCVRVVKGKFYLLDSGFTFSIADKFANGATKPFVAQVLLNIQDQIYNCARGHAQKNIDIGAFKNLRIPLPPLAVQQEIVAEIEGYQRVIDGARAVVESYRPQIVVDPEWPLVELGEVAELIRGITFRKSDQLEHATEDSLLVATTKAAQESGIVYGALYHIPRSLLKDDRKLLKDGDILISTANSLRLLGRTTHVCNIRSTMSFGAFMSVIRAKARVLDTYLVQCLRAKSATDFFFRNANTTTNISNLNLRNLAEFRIPLPPLKVQQAIVAEIEAEQALVAANRELIERFERKIAAAVGRVWGEG